MLPMTSGRYCFLSLIVTCLPVLCTQLAIAQPPSFEVASVKPAAPTPPGKGGFTVQGGPGSSDPGLATFTNIDLISLVAMAHGIQRHQLSGPDWLGITRFDITARVRPKTTQDEYRLMLQNLLTERFQLTLHRTRKELQVYELELAKNGLKLKELPVDVAATTQGVRPPPPYSAPPLGYQGPVNVVLGKASMERLASVLSGLLGEPVLDGTGLQGNYEIKFRALVEGHSSGTAATNPELDLFEALQEQLGLRLVRKKRLIEVLVVDHMEKAPTGN
jgi:uncharacterized protein (TIGR03435 family)